MRYSWMWSTPCYFRPWHPLPPVALLIHLNSDLQQSLLFHYCTFLGCYPVRLLWGFVSSTKTNKFSSLVRCGQDLNTGVKKWAATILTHCAIHTMYHLLLHIFDVSNSVALCWCHKPGFMMNTNIPVAQGLPGLFPSGGDIDGQLFLWLNPVRVHSL